MARKMLGKVDLLGLNHFGNPVGLNPIWGTLIGGGVAGITSLAVSHNTTGSTQTNSDLIGLGVGLAASGVMYALPATRHAALGAVLGAFLASGLSYLNRVLFGTVQLPAATAAAASQVVAATTGGAPAPGTSGMGIATTRALNGLGIATTRALNGLGIATTAQVPRAAGTIPGVAGPQVAGLRLGNGTPPVNLLGRPTAMSQQVRLMGGPQIHGMAGSWGATHFSR